MTARVYQPTGGPELDSRHYGPVPTQHHEEFRKLFIFNSNYSLESLQLLGAQVLTIRHP